MAWFKVDDNLDFHPKVVAAGNAAMGLWVRAGAYCASHLTDGFIPRQMIAPLGGRPRDVSKLVEVGLWIPGSATDRPENSQGSARDRPEIGHGSATGETDYGGQGRAKGDGWWFRNWSEFQPTKAQVEADRAATAERVREWRKRKSNGSSNTVTNTVTNTVGTPVPSRPVPSRTPSTTTAAPDGFAEFWEVWPRKEDKKKAGAAYAKALKRSDADTILAGAKRYRDDPNRLAQYTKLPTTWLNGDCWDDAPLPPRGDGRPSANQQPAYDPWAAGYAELERRRREAG